ncbi:DUF4389 domain-containing protein [Kitasatospora mediocidica]|uniref:DUF4389 domain-containing protein n=1 Tax=Kitasatospora mediocidica TaxID=58352 RepID=UPI000690AB20|nr:DUF4389 domain-containing protein [Kitasatospora mediocidica]
MATPGGWSVPTEPGPVEWLPALDIPEPAGQRRLTVLLRLLLLLPHFVILVVLSFVATLVVIVGWFAALATGRLPEPIARFLAGYVGYYTRVGASATLLVDAYPPFSLDPPADYPVRIELRPGRLNRLAVLFRLILMIPAVIIQSLASSGWFAVSVLIWLWVLIAGRMPRPLFEATAAITRFAMRVHAYGLMLTSAYPKGLFGDGPPDPRVETHSATRPLRISGAGTALLVLFLVLGLASNVVESVTNGHNNDMSAPRRISQLP